MRRAQSTAAAVLLITCAASVCLLAGCSREKQAEPPLSFEKLPDTTGLSAGAAVLEQFEPYRMDNGAVRVRGRMRLPDSTKVQIAIKQPRGTVSVAMAHVRVLGGQFDSPPLLGDHGPLPKGDYRFEVLVHFDADWQPTRVLRELGGGHALRGPGITRARNGDAALFITREGQL
jgi:hypothetical protein